MRLTTTAAACNPIEYRLLEIWLSILYTCSIKKEIMLDMVVPRFSGFHRLKVELLILTLSSLPILYSSCFVLPSTNIARSKCITSVLEHPSTQSFSPSRIKPKISIDGSCAFFFPGQGSQTVGMGIEMADNIPEARRLYERASQILGYDLLDICRNGPKDKLDSTEVAQPAILVCSMAALEKLRSLKGDEEVQKATVALGLSLGEYSALCYAGALSFDDAVRITKERGAAMQAAADSVQTGMVAVLGLPRQTVEALCQRTAELTGEPIHIANYLSEGNYVASGSKSACDMLETIAKPEFKALKAVRLAVAGAFHTSYMAPAVDRLRAVIEEVEFMRPRIPVISNVDGLPHTDPHIIKQLLLKQLTSPVLWENSVKLVLNNGMESGYELGPGKVLSGILKKIDRSKTLSPIG